MSISYDSEPVLYCRGCMSLRIRSADGVDYCDACGSTDVAECGIGDWEVRYRNRFGKFYIGTCLAMKRAR